VKEKAEYEKEMQDTMAQLQELEQRKVQLTTRAVELQGVLKELLADEKVEKEK